ncbi:MAG: DUF2442 domain-containing protein [Aestuariibaculum sp.]
MSILTISKSKFATDISFKETKMIILYEDGRELSDPLEWFRKLRNSTRVKLEKRRFIATGESNHSEELDEDISIENLLE